MTRARIVLERTYRATVREIWDMWTTKDGIESWWGPDGFRVEVASIDLRVGGLLYYAMIAAAEEMQAFMKRAGMPVRVEHSLRYTEVTPHERLAYLHAADFIPGVPAYDVATVVELHPRGHEVRMVLTFDPMHDELWTQRQKAGWEMELGKLAHALDTRRK